MSEIESVKKNLYFAIFLMIILYIIGIAVYHNIEGWTYLEALYFLTATFTTVGYGDITPKTELGRLLTVFIIWIGVSIGFFLIFNIAAYRETTFDRHIMDRFKIFRTLTSDESSSTDKKIKEIKKKQYFYLKP